MSSRRRVSKLKTKAKTPTRKTPKTVHRSKKRNTKANLDQILEQMDADQAQTEKVWVNDMIVEVPVKRKPKKRWNWGKIFLGAATATALAGLGIYGLDKYGYIDVANWKNKIKDWHLTRAEKKQVDEAIKNDNPGGAIPEVNGSSLPNPARPKPKPPAPPTPPPPRPSIPITKLPTLAPNATLVDSLEIKPPNYDIGMPGSRIDTNQYKPVNYDISNSMQALNYFNNQVREQPYIFTTTTRTGNPLSETFDTLEYYLETLHEMTTTGNHENMNMFLDATNRCIAQLLEEKDRIIADNPYRESLIPLQKVYKALPEIKAFTNALQGK